MEKRKRQKLLIGGIAAIVVIAAAVAAFLLLRPQKQQEKLDENGALLSVTQNGDTIIFYGDKTYAIQGDVEIQGIVFEYTMKSRYSVENGKLILEESEMKIPVSSKFGDFDVDGSISSGIEKGALVIDLKADNGSGIFDLAHFELGKEQAEKLNITGVTAKSWEDDGTEEESDEEEEAVAEPTLDANGALLTIESGGDTIAFFPDGTYRLLGSLIQTDGGLTVEFFVEVNDTYTVTDGKLVLPSTADCVVNADIAAAYGYKDVKGTVKCTSEVIDGLLELHFYLNVEQGPVEFAKFQIGKEEAEKLGVTGVTGDTVIEKEKIPASTMTSGGGNDTAPAQPSVSRDAKPISFTAGNYIVTFYSNGQYTQKGVVSVAGYQISVNVTDTYTIDAAGNLVLHTGNQASCRMSMAGQTLSFGADNRTALQPANGGYQIHFNVFANNQIYHGGTVTITAADVKKIQENFGLTGATPMPEPVPEPLPEPDPNPEPTPDPEPEVPENEDIIVLTSEAGLNLSLNKRDQSYTFSGKISYAGMDLAEYSLAKPAKYSVEDNVLVFDTATLKITALNPIAAAMEGEYEIPISVTKTEEGTLEIAAPVGEEPIVYVLTGEQAEALGLDMGSYGESGEVPTDPEEPTEPEEPTDPEEPTEPEEPEENPYVPDESKTSVVFYKEYGAFSVTGAGQFVMNGITVDMTFTAADFYTVGEDGTVTAANTADGLKYTLTYMGTPLMQDALATPETTIVREGNTYRVTLKTTVNGTTLTLAETLVEAGDVTEVPGSQVMDTVNTDAVQPEKISDKITGPANEEDPEV